MPPRRIVIRRHGEVLPQAKKAARLKKAASRTRARASPVTDAAAQGGGEYPSLEVLLGDRTIPENLADALRNGRSLAGREDRLRAWYSSAAQCIGEEELLTGWEYDFVCSIVVQLEQGRELSDKQVVVLDRVHSKVVGRTG